MPSETITSAVRLVNIGLFCALFVVLRARGLGVARRFFHLYLLFHAARSCFLLALPQGRSFYGWSYVATEPILWFFYVLIVVELYTAALKYFVGIAALSRWVLTGLVAVSLLISLGSLIPDLNSSHPFPIIHAVTAAGRAICTSLALFLLGITAFFISYPIPLSRNTVVHSAICSVYFLTLAAAYFVHNVVGPSSWGVVNLALVAVTSATLVAWIVFLRPEGERIIVEHRPQWSPETEEQLLNRLNALNSVLARSLRK